MKKNIAFFFHDTDYFSGATKSLIDIIDTYLKNNIINIVLVFPSNEGSAIDYYKNKDVIVITSHYYQIRKDLSESKLQSFCLLPKRMFDIVKSFIWIRTVTLPKLKKQNIDLVYLNTSFIISGYWIAKKLKVPIIAHFREFGEEDHKITIWFGRKKYYKIVNKYNHIICISKSLKKKYEKYINPKKISVIYNDISLKYINWNKILKKKTNSFNILLAGNITEGKGQLKVLQSIQPILKNNSKVKVFIAGGIGNKEYYKKIQNYISKNKLKKNVIFLGLVKDMNDLRKKMHIGIVSSDMEAFGRVTIEGMLSGMIMIGTNIGGTSELIKDGKTGFLLDTKLQEIIPLINKIIENYDEYYELLLNAFEYALSYTKGNCAKEILKIIEKTTK